MARVVLGRVPVLHPYSRYYSDGWAAQKFHGDRDIPAAETRSNFALSHTVAVGSPVPSTEPSRSVPAAAIPLAGDPDVRELCLIAAVRCGVMVGPTERLLTPEAIQELWDRAEAILGAAEFAALVSSHRNGSANLRHRLVDQLIRLDDAKSGHLSPIAETTASVSAAEVDAVLKLAEEWRTSPAWPEVRRGLRSTAEYLHSVGVLAVGSMLKVRHTATELVVAKAADREPDLALVVTHGLPLAVEVKAPQALWQHPRASTWPRVSA